MQSAWSPPGPSKYRLNPYGAADSNPSELHTMSTPSEAGARATNPLDPENPLFWFGAIAAVTFGLIAFGTRVKVAGKTLEVKVGDA